MNVPRTFAGLPRMHPTALPVPWLYEAALQARSLLAGDADLKTKDFPIAAAANIVATRLCRSKQHGLSPRDTSRVAAMVTELLSFDASCHHTLRQHGFDVPSYSWWGRRPGGRR